MECPVCHKDLNLTEAFQKMRELHYDCPHCFSSLFFKEGQCHVLSEEPVKEASFHGEEEQDLEEEDLSELSMEVPILENEEEVSVNSSKEEEKEPEESQGADQEVQEEEEPPSAIEEQVTSEEEASSLSQDFQETSGDHLEPQEESPQEHLEEESSTEQLESENLEKKEDFSDVEKFANTRISNNEGLFYYNLTIGEINSSDLREQVEVILKDEGLKLIQEVQSSSIKEGQLHLRKISPIQVHVIVRSLLGLPLDISWEQHLIADGK